MFIAEGENVQVEIHPCQEFFRRSIDLTVSAELFDLGIRAVNICVKVDENLKTTPVLKLEPNGLMQNAIRAITACPKMIVMPDVALDPYSIYGHDGIIANGDVENDTNDALVKWRSHARWC
jgi:porphobilinogen synthase